MTEPNVTETVLRGQLEKAQAELAAERAANCTMRNALLMARERLPQMISLPSGSTRIREIVEAVDAALATPGACQHQQRTEEFDRGWRTAEAEVATAIACHEYKTIYKDKLWALKLAAHDATVAAEARRKALLESALASPQPCPHQQRVAELEKEIGSVQRACIELAKNRAEALMIASEAQSDNAKLLAANATVAAEARRKGIEEAASMLESTNSHHVAIRMIRAFAQKGGE